MFKVVIKMVVIMCTLMTVCTGNVMAVGIQDPLRPPGYNYSGNSAGKNTKAVRGWTVNEILFSGGRRVAIVNDTAVVIGDRINGARVIDIKPAHVVLEHNKKIINARLNSVSVKKQIVTKIN